MVRRWLGRTFKLVFLLAVVLVVLVSGFAAWQARYGLPQPLIEEANRRLAAEGYKMEVERCRYLGERGWVLDGLRVFRTGGNAIPFFEGDVHARWPLLAIVRGQKLPDEVSVADARLTLQGVDWSPEATLHEPVRIEEVFGVVGVVGGRVRLDGLRGTSANLRLRVSGDLALPGGGGTNATDSVTDDAVRVTPGGAATAGGGRSDGNALLAEAIRQVAQLSEELDAARFSEPPLVEALLSQPDPARSPEVRFTLEAESPGRVAGIRFDHASCRGSYGAEGLVLDSLEAGDDAGHFVGFHGRYDPVTRGIEGEMDLSVPAPVLRELLPAGLTEQLQRAGVLVPGTVGGHVRVGRAPLAKAGRNWRGRIQADRLRLRGVWFEEASMDVVLSENDLVISNMVALVGSGSGQGRAEAGIRMDLTDGSYEMELRTACDPRALIPVARSMEGVLRAIDFVDRPPALDLEVSGTPGKRGSGKVRGTVEGTNLIYNSTLVDRAFMTVHHEKNVSYLRDIRFERPEGDVIGSVDVDLDRGRVRVDLNSTLDVDALARIAGPGAERVARSLTFHGDNLLTMQGEFDLTTNRQHRVKGTLWVEDGGVGWIVFDDCRFRWMVLGDVFSITDVQGRIFGGPFRGHAQITGLVARDLRLFVGMTIDGADLSRLHVPNRSAQELPLDGRLKARFDLQAALSRFDETLAVNGDLEIKDARLFRVPLLGGLSKHLSRLVPGFGYATQTELTTKFDLRDRRVQLRDAELLGNVLSISGKGSWTFDNRIAARVGVKLLGDSNLVVEAVRLITRPVTYLLEFRLTGTVDDPEWHLVRIPKELQNLFK